MRRAEAFFDTNVLIYFASDEGEKTERSERLIAGGGIVSVQVLNEFANVAMRKQRMSWSEISLALRAIREGCQVAPLTLEVHERGLALAQRHNFAIYDAMIVAAAQLCGARTLYTEELHNGLALDGLRIVNPYA